MDAPLPAGFDQSVSRLMLLGVGAAGSPRHAPAGLLLEYGPVRLGFDGGPGAEPPENVHAWLISDPFDPLQPDRRRISDAAGMPEPTVTHFEHGALRVSPLPLAGHAYGYLIGAGAHTVVWAPCASEFPAWARHAELMFCPAALAETANLAGVRRLILVWQSENEPDGEQPHAEWAEEGRTYRL
jgi:hypothetical protein